MIYMIMQKTTQEMGGFGSSHAAKATALFHPVNPVNPV
jgi:hypothetical protein